MKSREIVRPHLEEQVACAAFANESENQSQQGSAGALPPMIRSNGDGQQLGLVSRDPAESEADCFLITLHQNPRHAGGGQQLDDLLARPAALAQAREGIGMERRSDIEVIRRKRSVREGAGQSTVRLWPSGRVTFTPRR